MKIFRLLAALMLATMARVLGAEAVVACNLSERLSGAAIRLREADSHG